MRLRSLPRSRRLDARHRRVGREGRTVLDRRRHRVCVQRESGSHFDGSPSMVSRGRDFAGEGDAGRHDSTVPAVLRRGVSFHIDRDIGVAATRRSKDPLQSCRGIHLFQSGEAFVS